VAIKCLDEGVDVPSARTAIIMASTTNPREWIQRRGRVLRRCPGKEKATIYDIIVVPYLEVQMREEIPNFEKRILANEFRRYKEFSKIASNSLECWNKICDVDTRLGI
jgi:superfamily II DNA or RNA helicase